MKNISLHDQPAFDGSAIQKAPYAKPVLRVFGSVKSLTKGGTGSNVDGWGGNNSDAAPPGHFKP